jgi:hypothetical protein
MDKDNIDPEVKRLYWTFNCIACGKEITYFSVHEPLKDTPCDSCQLKELGKENNEN